MQESRASDTSQCLADKGPTWLTGNNCWASRPNVPGRRKPTLAPPNRAVQKPPAQQHKKSRRADGWVVLKDPTRSSNFCYIAPDGNRLGSKQKAKAYGKYTKHPFVDDPSQRSIGSFFTKSIPQTQPAPPPLQLNSSVADKSRLVEHSCAALSQRHPSVAGKQVGPPAPAHSE